jgi:hypothetical protein
VINSPLPTPLRETVGPLYWSVTTPHTETILQEKTGAIDDVHRTVLVCDNEEKRTEGKRIIEVLAKLKYELQHNRELTYASQPLHGYS